MLKSGKRDVLSSDRGRYKSFPILFAKTISFPYICAKTIKMIPQIKEINFPEYATLSTATASITDMGDKTISAQVKIDGAIKPDFSYDWEVEFQGERYIQPLREPQASKGNESINSIIDLTFHHKGIYDLKRYFFVSIAEVDAGTIMADNYITPLRLNLGEFVEVFQQNLDYYFEGSLFNIVLNPNTIINADDKKDIDINYTHLWDVLTRVYEIYGVRWSIVTDEDGTYIINIGAEPQEVSHIFEYGFEGGLMKFERQVQDPEIANVIFGRGSSENIPYRYFKNVDPQNPSFPADPDWIPELENIYFANLRGKTFRDYVRGWKSNPNRNTLNGTLAIEPIDPNLFLTSFAYLRGVEDEKFAPIEYVKNDVSIQKYGEIQKGLEHNEEIKPTIQGISIDGIGRVDQVVDVEEILVDEKTENTEWESKTIAINDSDIEYSISSVNISRTFQLTSQVYQVPQGYIGYFVKDSVVEAREDVKVDYSYSRKDYNGLWDTFESGVGQISHKLKCQVSWITIINIDTGEEIQDIVNIAGGTRFYIHMECVVSDFYEGEERDVDNYPYYGVTSRLVRTPYRYCNVALNFSWQLDYTPVHGQILGNYEDGTTRLTQTTTIGKGETGYVEFVTEEFTIVDDNAPATNVDMPFRVMPSLDGAMYDARPNVTAIDASTGERMSSLNLNAGTYKLRNVIQITNLSNSEQTFKVELLPTYIYYSYDSASWKPTFNIWIKNIWETIPNKGESDDTYAHRVWDAILGSHLGDDAKVVFSSGRLSGYSDWEFPIAYTPVRDTSKSIDGVPSEWRITLYKSDAEMETTNKWLPSIMTQASAGDHFYFIGIELPHQYVLWAEERLDKYKREELAKVMSVQPTFIVKTDKVRLNDLHDNDDMLLRDAIKIGNTVRISDFRFIDIDYEVLYIQSVTYTWDASTVMLPNIEMVLSNNVYKAYNPLYAIDEKINDISQVQSSLSQRLPTLNKTLKRTEAKTNKVEAQVANTENVALQASTLATEANNQVTAHKDVLYALNKQVNTLIGYQTSDAQKSVREIAEEVASTLIPTEIATATQRKTMVAGASLLSLQPNIIYDWSGSTLDSLALPSLRSGDATYDNKWMVRLSLLSSANLTIPFEVKWKDGRAPSWSSWCICDITFSQDTGGMYTLGEWKIYK